LHRSDPDKTAEWNDVWLSKAFAPVARAELALFKVVAESVDGVISASCSSLSRSEFASRPHRYLDDLKAEAGHRSIEPVDEIASWSWIKG